MANTTKKCPLNGEFCDPLSQNPDETANKNCSFFLSDMFASRCLYIDSMKAMPHMVESIKKIKIQGS